MTGLEDDDIAKMLDLLGDQDLEKEKEEEKENENRGQRFGDNESETT